MTVLPWVCQHCGQGFREQHRWRAHSAVHRAKLIALARTRLEENQKDRRACGSLNSALSRTAFDPGLRGLSDAELARALRWEVQLVKLARTNAVTHCYYHKLYPNKVGVWPCDYGCPVPLPSSYQLGTHYEEHYARGWYQDLALTPVTPEAKPKKKRRTK